ncbi:MULTISPECIES: DNA recombination protein RmuC [Bordetella]|uniref:DNA recombination protein RmuC n=2 Tax=Bordetella TaxID=517 RepID=A0A261W0Y8_9BORD|nr:MULTISPECIES: DNA recombination protein RmuC [Bordetella]MDM9558160.1 DNA recombination protein RmuC [Bordetella petrii]OZI79701.1 DNA recombination protein RmuC [Bordetella genomosp. 2]
MPLIEALPWIAAAAAVATLLVAVGLWLRPPADPRVTRLFDEMDRLERALRAGLDESHRGLRSEFAESTRGVRAELAQGHEALRGALARDALAARTEYADSLARFAAQFGERLEGLVALNDRRMQEVRHTVDQRLQALQADNGARLDEMRRTVDEKLHATLEQRLGESFRLVSDRLEAVHKGLGEMQSLAAGVGDLKRVLTNVKSRGTWGEVQLARLIEDTMTSDQYAANVKPVPGSDAVVEFAIRLPGRAAGAEPVWLPIDAKFPKEEYERLMEAYDAVDPDGERAAGAALARAVELQARQIAAKYVAPPHTTDFAIMFLPTEGLYAEVLRRPGLLDKLQGLRVNVAGPSNLAAMLNSLQMGFRTLAIEQRSSEVWQVLRAVKTEFAKFGDSLASVKKSLESASNKLGQTEVRTRAMLRNLKTVEALPDGDAERLLGPAAPAGDDEA